MADMFHNPQVVRNEEIGNAELVLQVLQQVDDLRLDRDVERRHRFVGDDQARLDRQRARDADALALPAAELVRIAIDARRRRRPTRSSSARDARAAAPRRAPGRARRALRRRCRRRACADSSEPNGSWKISCISRRVAAQRVAVERQQIVAVEAHRARRSARSGAARRRPSVVLPQPDSPTMPSVSPAARSKLDAVDGAHHAARAAEQARRDREVLAQIAHARAAASQVTGRDTPPASWARRGCTRPHARRVRARSGGSMRGALARSRRPTAVAEAAAARQVQ